MSERFLVVLEAENGTMRELYTNRVPVTGDRINVNGYCMQVTGVLISTDLRYPDKVFVGGNYNIDKL